MESSRSGLILFAVLIMNGQSFWVPCERGAVWCPHFNQPAISQGYVVTPSTNTATAELEVVNAIYTPAPSSIIEGIDQ